MAVDVDAAMRNKLLRFDPYTSPAAGVVPAGEPTRVMNELLPANAEAFIPGTRVQYAWNSSDLGALKKCPRFYQLTVIEGWRTKDLSMHLTFGGHFATAMQRFHLWKAEHNLTHDETLTLVVWALLQDTFGWQTFDTKKNRETLIRSVIWYFEAYRNDLAHTVILHDGTPAVELAGRMEVDFTIRDHPVLLCWHIDRLVEFGELFYVMDQKTTGSTISGYWFDQFNPHNQMTLYTVASRVAYGFPVQGVIIDGAQIAVGFTAFSRGITLRSNNQLEEFLTDFKVWVETAARYAEANYWPMNETSCNNFGKCAFRDICNKDPAVRQKFLETDFEVNHRNPLEV